ncbi:DUF2214 family protein [Chitinimonas sp. PSY-7]|uniref:DUF2214 family protein n=1 Tax=Chitinimonas sp. PSY-7 TaxID=3459088 RepID=UPI00403FCD7E
MSVALLAALHYLGAMVLMACLVAEHLLIKPELDVARARSLAKLDLLYGVTAMVQIGSGIARMYSEKGMDFYLHNPFFHAKLTVYAAVGILSIYPTLRFIAWKRVAVSEGKVVPIELKRVVMLIRIELLLLLLIPVLASMMARGIGI